MLHERGGRMQEEAGPDRTAPQTTLGSTISQPLRKGSDMIRWYFCEDTYGNACVQTGVCVQKRHMRGKVEHVSCRHRGRYKT